MNLIQVRKYALCLIVNITRRLKCYLLAQREAPVESMRPRAQNRDKRLRHMGQFFSCNLQRNSVQVDF